MALLKPLFVLFVLTCLYQEVFAQGCPPNLDFEDGTYQNWFFDVGKCCPITHGTPGTQVPGRHELMSGTALDEFGLFPVVAPGGGNFSLKLGNKSAGAEAEAASYMIHVPTNVSTYVLIYKYAVVFQDPQHATNEQPRFEVTAFDSVTGFPITCANFSFVATSTLPGFQMSTKNNSVYFKDWTTASLNLTQSKGRTVILRFSSGDCALGAHFGYGYIDVDCQPFQGAILNCNSSPTITIKAPPGFQSYRWTDQFFGATLATTETATVPAPSHPTTLACILTPYPGFGCVDTIYVPYSTTQTVTSTPDTILCTDNQGFGSTVLGASTSSNATPFTYKWTPATGLSCTNCSNPIAHVSVNTKYYVTVTDANNCSETDSVMVSLYPHFTTDIGLPGDTVCQYDNIDVKNIGINAPNSNYYWSLDTGGVLVSGDNTESIKASWQIPGLKKIKVRIANGVCEKNGEIMLYVKPTDKASVEINYNVCVGAMVKIIPRTSTGVYKWTIDENDIPEGLFESEHYVNWKTPGDKKFHLQLTSENGCVSLLDTMIRVHENPAGKIEIKNTNFCFGDTINLYTEPGDYYIYQWAPPGIFLSANKAEVSAVIGQNQLLSVNVTSQWGCSGGDTIAINSERCCEMKFPDAFTPNGDGINDQFKILLATSQFQLHTFVIMNRWGNVLFETTNSSKGWDGTYKGIEQGGGSYFYFVKYLCNGQTFEDKGNLLLIR